MGKKILSMLLLLVCFTVHSVIAAPGDLDNGFGIDGLVTTDFSGNDDWGFSVVVQADSKIIVAGRVYSDTYGYNNYALARYNSDGDLDTGFGTSGLVTTDFGTLYEYCNTVAIQADGKIIAAGGASNDFALVRYTADGALDTGFGTNGLVITDFYGNIDQACSMAIQADGKIIVAGRSSDDFALARYTADGNLDTGFGMGGLVITDFSGDIDYGWSVAIQADGKIIVAGSARIDTDIGWDFALARYTTDGDLDTGFGTGGVVTTDFSGYNDWGRSVAIQADGKIIVAGDSVNSISQDFALARYTADGNLDTGFGAGGLVTTNYSDNLNDGCSVAIHKDGKIIVAGITRYGIYYDFALLRYTNDGDLDTGFGTGGVVTTDFSGYNSWGRSVAIQADGKIIVAGYAFNGTNDDFALARYQYNGGDDSDDSSGGGGGGGCFINSLGD